MHKYDYYIQDYLLNQGTFSAEHIGDFTVLKQNGGTPAINFTYNKHAGTSQELVAFVAEREHKSKVVTGFDLEAHFDEVRQFMNTGKPWVIPGVGQLKMNMNREYELVPQQEEQAAAQERKRAMQSVHPTNDYGLERTDVPNSNRAGIILLTILIIAALGFAGYYLYSNQQTTADMVVADTVATQNDTMVNVPPSSNMNSTQTNTIPPATTPVTQQPAVDTATTAINNNGMLNVQFVISRTTNTAYAYKRFSQLKSYKIAVEMDSVNRDTSTLYKLYLTKSLAPADTARVKDSLSVYFGKPVRIGEVK